MIHSQSLWQRIFNSKGVRAYILLMGIFWVLGGIILAIWGYEESFLKINRLRFPLGDALAPHLTHFGDGLLLIGLMGIALSPSKAHWNWAMLVAMLAILAVIALCKNVIFEDWNRPLLVFSDNAEFFYNSLSVLKRHSFPSGHSAGIAGGMGVWLIALKPPRYITGLMMALGTIIIAMTRVYIGVHFFGDVIAGTFIGTLLAFGVGGFVGNKIDSLMPKSEEKRVLLLQVSGSILAVVSLFLSISLLIARYY